MTESQRLLKKDAWLPLLPLTFMLLILWRTQECRADLQNALKLCAENIIPALFPHLVLSEIFLSTLSFSGESGFLSRLLSRIFRLDGNALPLLLIGMLCGFPIGARLASRLYQNGLLEKKQAETLCAYANHTSPAFVIGGVGASLFSSVRIGVLLFLSQIFASLLCLLLSVRTRPKMQERKAASLSLKGDVSFVTAVRSGTLSILNICGFVLFFSLITGMLCRAFSSFSMPFSALLEVTNACKQASFFLPHAKKAACYFAVFSISFGGLCAGMQSALFMKEAGLSFTLYLPRKLFEGFLAIFFLFLLTETVGI